VYVSSILLVLAAQARRVTDEHPNFAVLEQLHTRSDCRGQGHATAISKHGTDLADRLGLPFYLDAAPLAMPLYSRLGFLVQDTQARWLADEEKSRDNLADEGKESSQRTARPFAIPMLRPRNGHTKLIENAHVDNANESV
jgi:hypothetical protein